MFFPVHSERSFALEVRLFGFSTSTFWREIQGAAHCRRGACSCGFVLSAVEMRVNFSELAGLSKAIYTRKEKKEIGVAAGEKSKRNGGVIRIYERYVRRRVIVGR